MSLRHVHFTVASFVGFNLLAGVAFAAGPPRAEDCARIDDDARRLACYDGVFGRQPAADAAAMEARQVTSPSGTATAAAQGTVAAAAVPVTADTATRTRREFGLSEQGKRALDENKAQPAELDSITGVIQSASRRPTGEQVFVLDDGQVWVETETHTKARVQPGDSVTIRKGSLGSFLLVTPKRVATHVRRVK